MAMGDVVCLSGIMAKADPMETEHAALRTKGLKE